MRSEELLDSPAARLATRLAFLIAGLGVACWAPLVPYAKARAGFDEAGLGLLLLCLGLGSVISMPVAAGLCSRFGSRGVILGGGLGIALALPVLAFAPGALELAAALLIFGGSIGAVDVAANVHGAEVQKAAGIPLMSNFHGLYSAGGLAGAAAVTAVLSAGVSPLMASVGGAVVILACLGLAAPRLLKVKGGQDAPFFVMPHGVVVLIGVLAAVIFLVEGAMLDWSAVLLKEFKSVPKEHAGSGYAAFSLAMMTGRLTGDRITAWLGKRRVLVVGALLTCAGITVTVLASWTPIVLAGFLVTGLGAANLVPVLFTVAAEQRVMPKDFAIAAISILGYAGILAGPAFIGFVAHGIGLPASFGILAIAVLLLAACSHVARSGE